MHSNNFELIHPFNDINQFYQAFYIISTYCHLEISKLKNCIKFFTNHSLSVDELKNLKDRIFNMNNIYPNKFISLINQNILRINEYMVNQYISTNQFYPPIEYCKNCNSKKN